MLRKLLPIILLCASGLAHSATLYVSDVFLNNSATTCTTTSGITPVSGNDLILLIETATGGATFVSVADSQGATVITDYSFAIDSTHNLGFGVYRVHNITDGLSHKITVTFSGSVNCAAWLVQASGVGSFGSSSTVASGTSSSAFLTNSLTPSQNGALLLADGISGGGSVTASSWTNGFAALSGSQSVTPSSFGAYLDQTTKASVDAGATLSASTGWSGLLVSYVPSGGSSCTTAGITEAGAFAVPTASSTVMRLKNGNAGTVDCSTVSYRSQGGNFVTN